jgi:radical SAM protein (TIGR01212 family)
MRKILFFKDWLEQRHGRAPHRIPISLPLSCPNRENNSGAGCVFCAEDGSRARHLKSHFSLKEQIEKGIAHAKTRYGAEPPHIAYFQAFTNTHAPAEKLRALYSEALSLADFSVVIIATRPDCLPDDVMAVLRELNSKYELWVELGVQTANDGTLKLIRRGHDFACVKEAARRLHAAGIKCAAHVILGLPGETVTDYVSTAKEILALPFSAVKIHNLLVLKRTPLAAMFHAGQVKTMSEYEHAAALAEFLRVFPEGFPVMRITADAAREDLIAPKWWMTKNQFIEHVSALLEKDSGAPDPSDVGNIPLTATADGSKTLWHPEYKQHFHSLAGARSEALKKFLGPCCLERRLREFPELRLLDIGFGLGWNALSALELAENTRSGRLSAVSLEKDSRTLKIAAGLFDKDSFHAKVISSLAETGSWKGDFSEIKVIFEDARVSVRGLPSGFDVIFLDAFSPETNPELWTYDFFRELKRLLAPDGVIAAYSSAYPVRGGLARCGLTLGESAPFGRKRGGTVAFQGSQFAECSPLPQKELDIIFKSSAGAPYRDPGMESRRADILGRRKRLAQKLHSKGVPRWHRKTE